MPHDMGNINSKLPHQMGCELCHAFKRCIVISIGIDTKFYGNAVLVGDSIFSVTVPAVPGIILGIVVHLQGFPVIHEKIGGGLPVAAVEVIKVRAGIRTRRRVACVVDNDVLNFSRPFRPVVRYLKHRSHSPTA